MRLVLFFVLALVADPVPLPDPVPSPDIVRRHDRPDSAHVALARAYPAVVKVGDRLGDGTLVHPEWVLTAAHVAHGMRMTGAMQIVVDGRPHAVDEIVMHPDWREMGPHDMALLRLAAPLRDIEPLGLYEGSDEARRVATLVGHGMNGDGRTGPQDEDGRKRAATNRVEEANERHLVFRFDEGDAATDLEGIPAGGDSGGPALIVVDGAPLVAGVSSLGEPGHNGPATYGALDYFGRVSTHLDWIRSVLGG